MKKHSVARSSIAQVYEHCPRRPYVELAVPQDALTVSSAVFTTESRDQGWADDKSTSFTWFDVALRRPEGRSDVADIKIHSNAVGKQEFSRATTRWDSMTPGSQRTLPRVETWLRVLKPGDVILLIPRAQYKCWVNIVRQASIGIEYVARPEASEVAASSGDAKFHRLSDDIRVHPTIHRPLNYADQQIRVLVITPCEQGYHGKFVGHFEYINLAKSVETETTGFHALSYYWSDASAEVPFPICDGEDVPGSARSIIGVSGTLYKAICRLSSKATATGPLRIWIDAICINQDDLEERSQQVAMMGSIYSRAEVVHVWLDDDFVPGLDEALRLIRDIVNVNTRICPGATQCRCQGTKHTLSTEQINGIIHDAASHFVGYGPEVFAQHIAGGHFSSAAKDAGNGGEGQHDVHWAYFMQSFFHHPWFQRVWVVQEAILSPKTVVCSANEEIPWEELLMVNKIASMPEYAGQARWSIQTHDSMPAIWNVLTESHGKGPLSILEVFLKALDLKATNPCDKLWGLLSFGHETREAAKIPLLLRPDYSKPVNKVMADFTRWWILEYRSLDVLSYVHSQATRAWRRTLWDQDPRIDATAAGAERPTWALATNGYAQLSHVTLRAQFPIPFSHLPLTKVPPDLDLIRPPSDPDTTYNPLELTLRGTRLGAILALGHPPREMVAPLPWHSDKLEKEKYKTLAAVFNRLFDPSARMGVWLLRGVNYHDEEWDPAVLHDVLECHVRAHWGYVVDEGARQHILLPQDAVGGGVVDGEGKNGEEVVGAGDGGGENTYQREESYDLPACVERCFFVLDTRDKTGKGTYGLCPWTAREGDVAVLLRGGGVPYLLRPVGNAHEGKYQFVGESFVELDGGAEDGSAEEVFVLV
ncbi:hypothetical protein OQA88_7398 [Cercophora sp. LCS_1]